MTHFCWNIDKFSTDMIAAVG